MKVSLSYSELRKLFAPVVPHAGRDDMLPVLMRIAVAASGGYLVAQATDRFTAAFQRVALAEAPPAGFAVLLEASDAKRLIHLLRPIRGSDPTVTIELDGHGGVHVSAEDAGLALGFRGIDVSFSSPVLTANSFPDLSGLLPKDFNQHVGEQSFNLNMLTKFKAAVEEANRGALGDEGARALCSIHMPSAPNKPLVFTAGPDFVGLVMPRRNHGSAHLTVPEALDSWRGTIPRNGLRPPDEGKAPSTPAPATGEEIAAAAGLSTHTDAEIDAAAGGAR